MSAQNERHQLENARHGLLRIHRALPDEERIRYERERGRVAGGGAPDVAHAEARTLARQ